MEGKMTDRDYFTLCCTQVRFGSSHYQIGLELRNKVSPLRTSTEGDDDSRCYHLVCFVGDILAACAVLHSDCEGIFRLQQFVVDCDRQGNGVGSCLLAFAENFVRARRGHLLHAYAPKSTASFFSNAGYHLEGSEPVETIDAPLKLIKRL